MGQEEKEKKYLGLEREKRPYLFIKYKLEMKLYLPVLLYSYSVLHIPRFVLLAGCVKAKLDEIS